MGTINVLNTKVIEGYMNTIIPMLSIQFPNILKDDLIEAVEYSIQKRFKNTEAYIDNSYKKKKLDSNLLMISEYILEKEPIVTASGVIFKKHGSEVNVLTDMTQKFMKARGIYKDKMFQYPKGSELFNKFNLLQLLSKLDSNALYGTIGSQASIFYNLYTAESITWSGQNAISTAEVVFESFLCNNVKFRNVDEIITFINNILFNEKERKFNDNNILDCNIDHGTLFEHIVETCGNGYIPCEEDLDIIWAIIRNLGQEDTNRIFYKNNLFAFMNNRFMKDMLSTLLVSIDQPYLNPNKPPKKLIPSLDKMWELLEEYVFYNHAYSDVIDRAKYMPRQATLFMDTDSTCLHLDPWYEYVKEQTKDMNMILKHQTIDPFDIVDIDEFGDVDPIIPFTIDDTPLDYDFLNNEIIEMERAIDPISILPQDNFRYAVVNVMCYFLDKLINVAMINYTKGTNSYRGDSSCRLIMKNEFLFKMVMLTMAKKNYAAIQELQEGYQIKGGALDIKGLSLSKSTLNPKAQKRLKKILLEDILNTDSISQAKVIKELAIFEKEIILSLQNGSKDYYKPNTIKSMNNYDNPMGIMGIKAAYAWNALKNDDDEAFDLTIRNGLDILKVNINTKNVENIKDTYPEVYAKAIMLLKTEGYDKNGIQVIAIPSEAKPPEWMLQYINYKTIVNDNLKNFQPPLESIGLQMVDNNVNYSNILRI